MLGKRRIAWALRLLITDVIALVASFLVAYALRVLLNETLGRAVAPLAYYAWLLALVVPVWVALLAALGAYGVRWTVRSRAWLVLRVCVPGLVVVTAALFLARRARSIAACWPCSPRSAPPGCGSSVAWSRRGSGARARTDAGPAWPWSLAPTSAPSG
jgi:hypothetical protein